MDAENIQCGVNSHVLGRIGLCFWTVLLESIYRELLSNWPVCLCHSPAFTQRWTEPMGRARQRLGVSRAGPSLGTP